MISTIIVAIKKGKGTGIFKRAALIAEPDTNSVQEYELSI